MLHYPTGREMKERVKALFRVTMSEQKILNNKLSQVMKLIYDIGSHSFTVTLEETFTV